MRIQNRLALLALSLVFTCSLTACAPEIGSDKWCANLKEKPKGDWSFSEAADYSKHCLFKVSK